jgi:AraC-like DNA-binding protein
MVSDMRSEAAKPMATARVFVDQFERAGHSPAELGPRLAHEPANLRIEQKAKLLESVRVLVDGGSVTDAAMESGYSSVSAYIAAFKQTFGYTPGAVSERATTGNATTGNVAGRRVKSSPTNIVPETADRFKTVSSPKGPLSSAVSWRNRAVCSSAC